MLSPDRSGGRSPVVQTHAFPTRRAFACLGLCVVAFAWYVSLLPFRLTPTPLDAAWNDFLLNMSSWPASVPRVNFLANMLLFVPVGFGFYGAVQTDRAKRFSVGALLASVCASATASLVAEFLQEFTVNRVVAGPDVVAQMLGSGIGIAAWLCAGPDLVHWIRDTQRRTHHDRATRALVAYAALWAFANLAPFDITLSIERLGHRWQEGEIVLIPFTSRLPPARAAWDAAVTAVSAIPLGALLLVGWQQRGERRSSAATLGLGVSILIALETSQMFIRSHGADMTDVVCGAVGVFAGALIGVRVFDRSLHTRAHDHSARWAWAALAAWCLMLAAYHWQPFDFVADESSIRQKLGRVSLVPLAGYRSGSDLNAFNTLLAKLGMAVPFGAIASIALRRFQRRSPLFIVMWVSLAATIFGALELGQFFLPTRVPDPSDVGLGVVGSAGGIWLVRWLRAGYQVRKLSTQAPSSTAVPVGRNPATTGMLSSRKKMEGQEE